MPEQLAEFQRLMRAVQDGSESAARELVERYGDHVLRVVRGKLHRGLRSRFDSIDFRQDVWASFFALPAPEARFRSPEDLATFLAAMANHKVADAFRDQMQRQKRALARETSLTEMGSSAIPQRGQATPSQQMVAQERWREILRRKRPLVQKMLRMLRRGCSYDEVSAETGLHLKEIPRFVRAIRSRMGE
jgi:RNA polymerase sigma-70 factor (ECF subfamily)